MQTRARSAFLLAAPAFAAGAFAGARLNFLAVLTVVVIIHNEVRAL